MAENSNDPEIGVVDDAVAKEDPKTVAAKLTGQLMADPNVMAAFGNKLASMVGQRSGYIESLPKAVKRRLKALKKLQLDIFNIEAKFYEEVHSLECKYTSQYKPLFDKRQDIVNAVHEPTDSECEWPSDEEEEEEKDENKDSKILEIEDNPDTKKDDKESEKKDADENTKGVPEFWLTIFKNVEHLASMLQEHDEPVLKSLLDIRVTYSPPENMGFTLEFVFAPNEYFNNTSLTKEYIMNSKPTAERPLVYDGPEITKCIGCTIDWKKGKNLTIKNVKQKKGKGANKKVVTKTVKAESFFNFFSPPEVKEGEEEDEETESILLNDYEIGQLLQSSIIPKAVLYFTGEALDDDMCDDDEYEEGEEGEDGEYDEDGDPDYKPAKGAAAGQECKQQ